MLKILESLSPWALAVFGFINLFGTFWLFGYVTRSMAKRVIGKELYEKLKNDPKDKQRAATRRAEMEAAFDDWHQPDPLELKPEIANTCLADRNGNGDMVLGSLSLKVDNGVIRVLDLQIIRRAASVSTHTALVLTPSVAPDNVPDFYLRPNRLPYGIQNSLQRYETVEEVFADDYFLESTGLTYKARELFETDREENAGRLIEYVRSRRWTAELSRGRLIVYKFDECVAADKISQFAAEVVTLHDLIVETADLVDQHLTNKLNRAADRLETTTA